jgi:hypothetical protein
MDNSTKMKRLTFGVFAFLVLAGESYLVRHQIVYAITPAVGTISNIVYYENSTRTWREALKQSLAVAKQPAASASSVQQAAEAKPAKRRARV